MIRKFTRLSFLIVAAVYTTTVVAQQKNNQQVKKPNVTTQQNYKKPPVAPPTRGPVVENGVYLDIMEALKNPDKVTKLRITAMGKFPDELRKFKNLTELSIKGPFGLDNEGPELRAPVPPNSITDAPSVSNKKSKAPRMNGNVNEIPEYIFGMTNLTVLKINAMNVGAVNPSITKLNKLKVLDLDENPIGIINEEIAKLTELEELYVAGGQADLPKTINKMTKLKVLSTSSKNLPDLANLTELRVRIDGQASPDRFTRSTKLKKLYISGNAVFDDMMFQQIVIPFNELTSLIMPTIPITVEQLKSVAGLPKLENIEFRGFNGMQPVEFNGFPELKKFNVRQLNVMDPASIGQLFTSLEKLKKLEEVTITFSPVGLESLKKIKKLNLIISGSSPEGELVEVKKLKNVYGLILDGTLNRYPKTLNEMFGTIKMLDISECEPNIMQNMNPDFDKFTSLEKMYISAQVLPMISNQFKSTTLKELVIKRGNRMGPPTPPEMITREGETLKKNCPNAKIVMD